MTDDSTPKISETEKAFIDSVIRGVHEQYSQYSLSNEISQENEKLLDCRHEIVITITAKVLEQDEKGEPVGAKEICKQNYHVPVPQNKHYHEYMDGFFNRLRECIASSDQTATQTASEITPNG